MTNFKIIRTADIKTPLTLITRFWSTTQVKTSDVIKVLSDYLHEDVSDVFKDELSDTACVDWEVNINDNVIESACITGGDSVIFIVTREEQELACQLAASKCTAWPNLSTALEKVYLQPTRL